MNDYKEKQEAKKERFEDLATKNREKSEKLFNEQSNMRQSIPFGQPILVGHHSEKGHRSLINKMDNKMRKSIEADKKADYYDNKVANMGKTISSDDPEAIQKLKNKLAKLEDLQVDMKEANAHARAEKTARPHPAYQLTNNNALIRGVKQRIKKLEFTENREENADIVGDGYVLHENKEENRIQFLFKDKPSEETRQLLKSRGFRWSPRNEAWQRQLNNSGIYNAQYLIKIKGFNI